MPPNFGVTLYQQMMARAYQQQQQRLQEEERQRKIQRDQWRDTLTAFEHEDRRRQAEFDRMYKLAALRGKYSGQLGQEAPTDYFDPRFQEASDVAHMGGRFEVGKWLAEQEQEQAQWAGDQTRRFTEHLDNLGVKQADLERKRRADELNADWRAANINLDQQRTDAYVRDLGVRQKLAQNADSRAAQLLPSQIKLNVARAGYHDRMPTQSLSASGWTSRDDIRLQALSDRTQSLASWSKIPVNTLKKYLLQYEQTKEIPRQGKLFGPVAENPLVQWANLVNQNDAELARAVDQLFNDALQQKSGLTVTEQEMLRHQRAIMKSAWTKPEIFVQSMKEVLAILENATANRLRGFSPRVVQQYVAMGGITPDFFTLSGKSDEFPLEEVLAHPGDDMPFSWRAQGRIPYSPQEYGDFGSGQSPAGGAEEPPEELVQQINSLVQQLRAANPALSEADAIEQAMKQLGIE